MISSNPARMQNYALGLWLAAAAGAMFLTGLAGAILVIKNTHEDWPPSAYFYSGPWTSLKIVSLIFSVFLLWASNRRNFGGLFLKEESIRGAGQTCRRAAFLMGSLSLLFQGLDWNRWRQVPDFFIEPWGASYFVLTGAHSFLTLIGLLILLRTGRDPEIGRVFQETEGVILFWIFIAASGVMSLFFL